jgi:hypothetical protein
MTDQGTLTKQRTGALLAAAQERTPHIDWRVFTTHGPAIIGALPNGKGSVLVMQYDPNSYTLRHNTRMVRRGLAGIEDVCDAIASLGDAQN